MDNKTNSFGVNDNSLDTKDQEQYRDNITTGLFPNIAFNLNKEEILRIVDKVVRDYDNDNQSRDAYEQQRKNWNKMFDLYIEEKTEPWPGAANVIMPVITTACINMHARLMEIFYVNDMVSGKPLGNTKESFEMAARAARFVNYQLKVDIDDFDNEMSGAIMALVRDGVMFLKVFYDCTTKQYNICHVHTENMVVNYDIKNFNRARKTERIVDMTVRDIRMKILQGIYIDQRDIVPGVTESDFESYKSDMDMIDAWYMNDDATPVEVIEQHTYLDLNHDGIGIPVIVTIDYTSKQLLSIIYNVDPYTKEECTFYVNYDLIKNPESIYGFGFGRLLYHISSAINTAFNQTFDLGSLRNSPGLLVSARSGLKKILTKIYPGLIQEVKTNLDSDIRTQLTKFEWPDPSPMMLQLIQYLTGQAEKLTSVTEVITGTMPSSDTTATAAQIALEQGIKVFTGIMRHVIVRFNKTLKQLQRMNYIYLVDGKYAVPNDYLDVKREDFNPVNTTFILNIDPTTFSRAVKMQEFGTLMQFVQANPFLAQDPRAWAELTALLLINMNTIDDVTKQSFVGWVTANFQSMLQQALEKGINVGMRQGNLNGYQAGVQDANLMADQAMRDTAGAIENGKTEE